MSFYVLLMLLVVVAVYWFMTQIRPQRRQESLLRPTLAGGLLEQINEARHERGLPLLEEDDDLCVVAERKATHQIMTGRSGEGWHYPPGYSALFGRSLLLEALVEGPAVMIGDRLAGQRDLLDGEWIRCGIGVAGGSSGHVAVALVLCREAWEPMPVTGRSFAEKLVLGD